MVMKKKAKITAYLSLGVMLSIIPCVNAFADTGDILNKSNGKYYNIKNYNEEILRSISEDYLNGNEGNVDGKEDEFYVESSDGSYYKADEKINKERQAVLDNLEKANVNLENKQAINKYLSENLNNIKKIMDEAGNTVVQSAILLNTENSTVITTLKMFIATEVNSYGGEIYVSGKVIPSESKKIVMKIYNDKGENVNSEEFNTDTNGNFSYKFDCSGKPNGDYTARLHTDGIEDSIEYKFNVNNDLTVITHKEKVIVAGKFEDDKLGQISIKVLNDKGDYKYVNQIGSDSLGKFFYAFDLKGDKTGKYTLLLNTKNKSEITVKDFDYKKKKVKGLFELDTIRCKMGSKIQLPNSVKALVIDENGNKSTENVLVKWEHNIDITRPGQYKAKAMDEEGNSVEAQVIVGDIDLLEGIEYKIKIIQNIIDTYDLSNKALITDAKDRVKEGRKTIEELLKHKDEIDQEKLNKLKSDFNTVLDKAGELIKNSEIVEEKVSNMENLSEKDLTQSSSYNSIGDLSRDLYDYLIASTPKLELNTITHDSLKERYKKAGETYESYGKITSSIYAINTASNKFDVKVPDSVKKFEGLYNQLSDIEDIGLNEETKKGIKNKLQKYVIELSNKITVPEHYKVNVKDINHISITFLGEEITDFSGRYQIEVLDKDGYGTKISVENNGEIKLDNDKGKNDNKVYEQIIRVKDKLWNRVDGLSVMITDAQGKDTIELKKTELPSELDKLYAENFEVFIGKPYELPKEITALMTDGKNKNTAVTWKNAEVIIKDKEGEYELTGFVKEFNKEVKMKVKVQEIKIDTVYEPENMKAVLGKEIKLPKEVQVLFNDDEYKWLPVIWCLEDGIEIKGDFIGQKDGDITLLGKFKNYTKTFNVTIKVEKLKAESVEILGDMLARTNEECIIPAKIKVKYNDGSEQIKNIIWKSNVGLTLGQDNKIDTSKEGKFILEGNIEGIEGEIGIVKLNIEIRQPNAVEDSKRFVELLEKSVAEDRDLSDKNIKDTAKEMLNKAELEVEKLGDNEKQLKGQLNEKINKVKELMSKVEKLEKDVVEFEKLAQGDLTKNRSEFLKYYDSIPKDLKGVLGKTNMSLNARYNKAFSYDSALSKVSVKIEELEQSSGYINGKHYEDFNNFKQEYKDLSDLSGKELNEVCKDKLEKRRNQCKNKVTDMIKVPQVYNVTKGEGNTIKLIFADTDITSFDEDYEFKVEDKDNYGTKVLVDMKTGKVTLPEGSTKEGSFEQIITLRNNFWGKEEIVKVVINNGKITVEDVVVEAKIERIQKLDDLFTFKGEDIKLPENVTVFKTDGTQEQKKVTWNKENLDIKLAGECNLQGTIEGTDLKAELKVIVKEKTAIDVAKVSVIRLEASVGDDKNLIDLDILNVAKAALESAKEEVRKLTVDGERKPLEDRIKVCEGSINLVEKPLEGQTKSLIGIIKEIEEGIKKGISGNDLYELITTQFGDNVSGLKDKVNQATKGAIAEKKKYFNWYRYGIVREVPAMEDIVIKEGSTYKIEENIPVIFQDVHGAVDERFKKARCIWSKLEGDESGTTTLEYYGEDYKHVPVKLKVGEYQLIGQVYCETMGAYFDVTAKVIVQANASVETTIESISPLQVTMNVGDNQFTLPTEASAKMSDKTSKQIKVTKWYKADDASKATVTSLNLKIEGTFEFIGELEGTDKTASLKVTVKKINITEIISKELNIFVGDKESDYILPTTVQIKTDKQENLEVSVKWEAGKIDTSSAKEYDIEGTVDGTDKKATLKVKVTVKEKDPLKEAETKVANLETATADDKNLIDKDILQSAQTALNEAKAEVNNLKTEEEKKAFLTRIDVCENRINALITPIKNEDTGISISLVESIAKIEQKIGLGEAKNKLYSDVANEFTGVYDNSKGKINSVTLAALDKKSRYFKWYVFGIIDSIDAIKEVTINKGSKYTLLETIPAKYKDIEGNPDNRINSATVTWEKLINKETNEDVVSQLMQKVTITCEDVKDKELAEIIFNDGENNEVKKSIKSGEYEFIGNVYCETEAKYFPIILKVTLLKA